MENSAGAHCQQHAGADKATTVNAQYTPGILSMSHLKKKTIEFLKKRKKVEGVDYKVASDLYINYAFSPNNPFHWLVGMNTNYIPLIRKLQT
eukprot:11776188-Ditylum_brightwellii.AAC.1